MTEIIRPDLRSTHDQGMTEIISFSLSYIHTEEKSIQEQTFAAFTPTSTSRQRDTHSHKQTHRIQKFIRGRNSSLVVCLACCLLLDEASWVPSSSGENFCGRVNLSLGVNVGSNSIPPQTPSYESINQGLVRAHMHSIARTQRSWHSCPRMLETKTHPACTSHEDGMWLPLWLD